MVLFRFTAVRRLGRRGQTTKVGPSAWPDGGSFVPSRLVPDDIDVTPYSQVLLTAAAGVVATLTGVLAGGIVSRRATRSQWSRETHLTACTTLLGRYAATYRAVRQRAEDGAEPIDWAAWHQGLHLMLLTAAPQLVERVLAVDEQFWRISVASGGGGVPLERWLELRKPIDQAYLDMVNSMRAELQLAPAALPRAHGRPDDNDPVWQLDPRRPL